MTRASFTQKKIALNDEVSYFRLDLVNGKDKVTAYILDHKESGGKLRFVNPDDKLTVEKMDVTYYLANLERKIIAVLIFICLVLTSLNYVLKSKYQKKLAHM